MKNKKKIYEEKSKAMTHLENSNTVFFVLLQVIFDMEFPGKKVVKISLKLHNLQKHYSE